MVMTKLTHRMGWIFLAGGLVVAAGLGHLTAQRIAIKIQDTPDPYTVDQLTQEPQGETIFIRCDDGTMLRALVGGGGDRTVVLAHGYSASLLEWNLVWPLLVDAGYRVIAFDQRGHGQSSIGSEGTNSAAMARDYRAVLEHFDVRNGILVGHSMGGFLSMVFHLTYPDVVHERLDGAVMMATFAGNVAAGNPQNILQIQLAKTGFMQLLAKSNTYKWLWGASFYGKTPSPAGIQVFLDSYARARHAELIPILEAFQEEDYYKRLGEIAVPCVILSGDADKTIPSWHSHRMGELIPEARNLWVPGKGHFLNWEAPEVVVEAIQSL